MCMYSRTKLTPLLLFIRSQSFQGSVDNSPVAPFAPFAIATASSQYMRRKAFASVEPIPTSSLSDRAAAVRQGHKRTHTCAAPVQYVKPHRQQPCAAQKHKEEALGHQLMPTQGSGSLSKVTCRVWRCGWACCNRGNMRRRLGEPRSQTSVERSDSWNHIRPGEYRQH